ncbi:zf-HC2 domain-containing protein [bacterium]|nr:zf-HC2 domain-containing protein [bacterium]
MKCSKYKQLLIEYADGRLEDNLSKKLEVHLENCHHCRIELETLKKSLSVMIAEENDVIPEPSAEFIPKLRQQIEQLNPESRKIFSFQKNPYIFANPCLKVGFAMAVLVFILGAIVVLKFSQNHRPGLTIAQIQVIKQMPEGKTLIEMLPASQPYIDALLAAQQKSARHSGITSTLDNINIQLLDRVFQILEMSAEALGNPEIKEEEELSCYEEVI